MLSSQVQEERRFLTKKSYKIYQCVDVLICQYDNGAKIKIISQLANVLIIIKIPAGRQNLPAGIFIILPGL